MKALYLIIVLAPLLGAILAGFFGKKLGRTNSHRATIAGVTLSFLLSFYALTQFLSGDAVRFDETIYTWMISGGITFEVGFLVDKLTVLMMVVVTFVSLMVHIYTIGYMQEDPGYQRFFSYISLFTFSMLMLVMANNFMQLFFGWEAVGLVSYLLIGFWYTRETAVFANMKAFLVNRVGDFGFLLGIAAIYMYAGSLNYAEVFAAAPALAEKTISIFPGSEWALMSVICILLFIGAMGKSAQVPLHVWLPDSMEGPTPISALIHAATMVTAGIFMVARMSPLFELSETALTLVMVIGSITAFFMGLIGIVQNDIKRVVAYSTLSQLGYMTVALGVSAYSAAIFHLMTHAFFKALLFLAAGSVIIALHHEQDIRKMGGLRKYMPITYWTSLIGSLALIGFPGTSGFFSKDTIIEAVHASHLPGASWLAYPAVLLGVFITAFYSFRMFFLVFHGKTRMDKHTREHCHETPRVVTWPLIALAIPSVILGAITIGPVAFGEYFNGAIFVIESHNVLAEVGKDFHGPLAFISHAFHAPAIYLAAMGVFSAWFIYMVKPSIADAFSRVLSWPHRLLENKFGFDDFNQKVFAGGARAVGEFFWSQGDQKIIDGVLVNGSAKSIAALAAVTRFLQTGYLYHYAFAMIVGVVVLLTWFVIL